MPLAFSPEDWARLLVDPFDSLQPHEKTGALEFARTLGNSESPRDTAALFQNWAALPGAGPTGYVEDVLTYLQSRLAPGLITDAQIAGWRTALADGRAAKDPRVKLYVAARDKANTERALIIEREISTLADFLGTTPAELRMTAILERTGMIIWLWEAENREFFLATEREHAMLAMSGLTNNLTLMLDAPGALTAVARMTESQIAQLERLADDDLEACHDQIADHLEGAGITTQELLPAVLEELPDWGGAITEGLAAESRETAFRGYVVTEILMHDIEIVRRGQGLREDGKTKNMGEVIDDDIAARDNEPWRPSTRDPEAGWE